MVLRSEDMPCDENGITPDLIVNPHAIPSRMTIGQLIEMVCGRLATEEGRIVDGTPFRGQSDAHTLGDMLEQYGLTRHACSRMTNGITGEVMESLVFTGPCYYQKLKHMVIDKIHGRSRGPLNFLTRQPIEGCASLCDEVEPLLSGPLC